MQTKKYRTGLKRFWAAIIDGIIFLPLLFVEHWIYKTTDNISVLFAWATFMGFVPLFYSVILHYRYGQTYGKWVTGVKVLDISESKKMSFLQAIYRDSFYLVIAVIGFVYYSFRLYNNSDQENILIEYSEFANNPIFWWSLIELVTMLTNSRRRALHDFIARSIVVRTDK